MIAKDHSDVTEICRWAHAVRTQPTFRKILTGRDKEASVGNHAGIGKLPGNGERKRPAPPSAAVIGLAGNQDPNSDDHRGGGVQHGFSCLLIRSTGLARFIQASPAPR